MGDERRVPFTLGGTLGLDLRRDYSGTVHMHHMMASHLHSGTAPLWMRVHASSVPAPSLLSFLHPKGPVAPGWLKGVTFGVAASRSRAHSTCPCSRC